MAGNNKERIALLKVIKEFRDSHPDGDKILKTIAHSLWNTTRIDNLANQQLQILVNETHSVDKGLKERSEKREKLRPQKPQKREIVSLEDYAKQYDISKLFLTLIPTGRGGPPRPFILRAGLLWKMDKKYGKFGYEIIAEPVKLVAETEGQYATFRGTVFVYNEKGEVRSFVDIATATPKNAPFQKDNLDEMASTRATNRAMRLATGMGLCSVEELPEYVEEER